MYKLILHFASCRRRFLLKSLLIMKLVIILLTTTFLQAGAEGYAQRVTINVKNASIEQIFESIQQQTGYDFLYNSAHLRDAKLISLNVRNVELLTVLKACFADQPLDYQIENTTILVTKKMAPRSDKSEDEAEPEVQDREVTGRVTNTRGEPLAGVTVAVKGRTAASTTNTQGYYRLTIPNEVAVLVFTSVGYSPQESTIGASNTINIVLKEFVSDLEGVVVVGYGTQKKVNLTGAVSTVDAKTFESRPVQNAVQALQGVVPGLNISQVSGEVGLTPNINIRGIATIGEGSSGAPLILIDGMEADLNTINPQDIKSISVLKDAAASSIYGSRAPFGVILVTTKKGSTGRATINYNGNVRSSSPILVPDMVDSYTFALYFNDMMMNSGKAPYFDQVWLQRIKDFKDGNLPMNTYNGKQYPMTAVQRPGSNEWATYDGGNDNVDWYDALYKSSTLAHEHSLSVSGGTENTTYYASVNYLGGPGLMKMGGDHYDRIAGTAKINARLSKIASLSYIGRFTRATFDKPQTYRGRNDFWFAEQAWPMLPLYDPNGYLLSAPSAALFIVDGGRQNQMNDKIYQQLKLTIEPLKDWKIFADFNYSMTDVFNHIDVQKLYNHDINGDPLLYDGNSSVSEDMNRANYFSPNIYTEYSRSAGDHNFKLMAGYQSEIYKYRSIAARRNGIIVPSLPTINTTSGSDNNGNPVSPTISGDYLNWSTQGFFGRLNYNYNEKYLFEANLRYDGTSRFRSDRRWGLFPSVSAGWNISHEAFWKDLEQYINNFKIRGSYGELGNQNTSSFYPTYSVMGIGTANGSWLINGTLPNTVYPPALISSSLTWEKVRTYNIGVDLSFLKNRLTASFDHFVRYTDDMVGPAPELPVILGIAVPKTNNTNLKTYGVELELNWEDRLSNGLGYNVRFNLADSRTTILEYPNPTGNIGYTNDGMGYIRYTAYHPGERYGDIWGYTTIGIAKTQAEMDAHLAKLTNGAQTALGTNWSAGDIMYQDLNGDGKIDAGANTINDHGDLSVIGNITPRYSFGFNLGADFRGFDFSVFFQGVMKRDYFNNGYMFWGAGRSMWESTVLKQHLDYFRDDPNNPLGLNIDSYYPRPETPERWDGYMGKNKFVQTRYLQNAAYVRLKNINIGYTLPHATTRKIGISRLRIYFSGENIWTGTKLTKIYDPELVDNPTGNAYPLSKVLSFGVNVFF